MKKINLLLFLLVLLPISFVKVNARMLTVSEVAKELDNEYIDINVNSTNSTLDFSYQGKTVFSLKYTDEYLLYDDPVTEVTSDKAMYATYEPMLIPELIEAEFRLSGLSYYNYIKLSLDTDKITKLANTYGVKEGANSDNLPSKDDESDDDNNTENTTDTDKKDDLQNPETGEFLPTAALIILILGSAIVLSRIKNKFVRI